MTTNRDGYSEVFHRAWEVINKDPSISQEERNSILKLIRVLVDTAESVKHARDRKGEERLATHEVISRYSLLAMVKQQADELDALKRISLNLTSSLDLKTVLDVVVTEAMQLVQHANSAHIFLYTNGELTFGASLNNEGVRDVAHSMPRPNGLTTSVLQEGAQVIVEDISTHTLYKDMPLAAEGSIIGIPLKFNNAIVGVMNLSRSVTGSFTKAELRLLGLLADQAAVAISNANLHRELAQRANTDSMTGLPNRRALEERLQGELNHASRTKSQFAVVMMDLDGFKSVNDTYGHSVGDEVLRHVFNFLAERTRSADFLARYGGDELTLILRDSGLQEAQTVTRKVIDLMGKYSFTLPGKPPIKLGITAGIAFYPYHAQNAGNLLRAADAALYQAKKHDRGSYAVAKIMTGPLDPLALKSQPKE
jgi:diguanylate cyclase (GGDEF)-like protein